jgi:hypothetical protein
MAYQSYYWRQIIKRELSKLQKALSYTHKEVDTDLDKHYSHLEIEIMTLAYVVRKLAHTGKLPDKTMDLKIKAVRYPPLEDCGKRWMVDLDKEYDLGVEGENVSMELWDICNQIIHSHILEPEGSYRRAFKYLYFVSDKKKNGGINKIEIADFIKLINVVADSEVKEMRSTYDKKEEKWIVTRN